MASRSTVRSSRSAEAASISGHEFQRGVVTAEIRVHDHRVIELRVVIQKNTGTPYGG